MIQIKNEQTLTEVVGGWPSFHDAEVVSMTLDRRGSRGPIIEAAIHVFEMTSEVNAQGYFALKNHVLATLRFYDVALESLRCFNNQNVLFELILEAIDPDEHEGRMVAVLFESSHGVEATFECSQVEVVSAVPFTVDAS